MTSSHYSGQSVDLEVARYGLRTFRPMASSQANLNPAFAGIFLTDTAQDPLVLGSVAMTGAHWANGTCVATCLDELSWMLASIINPGAPIEHRAPHESCDCGIYASLTLGHLECQYPNYTDDMVAVIAAEGQTLIGTRGFRTERARVVAYWCKDYLAAACQRQFQGARRYTSWLGAGKKRMLRDYGLS